MRCSLSGQLLHQYHVSQLHTAGTLKCILANKIIIGRQPQSFNHMA